MSLKYVPNLGSLDFNFSAFWVDESNAAFQKEINDGSFVEIGLFFDKMLSDVLFLHESCFNVMRYLEV